MTEAELKKWFEEIAASVPREGIQAGTGTSPEATRFLPEAESALAAAFPPNHVLHRQWEKVKGMVQTPNFDPFARNDAFYLLVGIFDSGHAQLKAGRRGNFTSIARSSAEDDLLGVASELLDASFHAAGAVTAGGALEVHLRWLCVSRGVKWEGKDQIEPYKAALERAEKAATGAGITTTDGKLVTAWGGLRNDAAHKPDEFAKVRTVEEVRAMITGVREFIARTT